MNGTCTGTIFWVPAPWGLGEGPKGQISLNLNYKVNYKVFKPNFVYHLRNERLYYIRQDFHSAAWVMPRGGTWGVPWGVGGQLNIFSEIQPDLVCELLT